MGIITNYKTTIVTGSEHRSQYWDSVKGILIILVVLEMDRENRFNMSLYEFLYVFHMPLFIFVSGLFLKTNVDKKNFLKTTGLLLETFLVFDILYLLFYCHIPRSIGDLLTPSDVMWYLFVLILFRTLLFIYNKWCSHNVIPLLLFSLLLGIFVGFIPCIGAVLSLSRFFCFMPFFIMGVYCGTRFNTNSLNFNNMPSFMFGVHIPKWLLNLLAICFCLIIFSVAYWMNNKDYFLLLENYSYAHLGGDLIVQCLYRIGIWMAAVVLSWSILTLIKPSSLLSLIGMNSLGIYLIHNFFVRVFRIVIHAIGMPTHIGVVLISGLICLILSYLFAKSVLFQWLQHPIEKLFSMGKK